MRIDNSASPNVVILSFVAWYLSADDLVQFQYVCKEWRLEFITNSATTEWFHRQVLLKYDPYATIPRQQEIADANKDLRKIHKIRRELLSKKLPTMWKKSGGGKSDFRQSCRFGKYSRWVLEDDFDDASFISELAWAVRMLSCLAPVGYSTLDGADVAPYNPVNSTCASDTAPGWHLISSMEYVENLKPKLLFEEDEFVGLYILNKIIYDFHHDQDVLEVAHKKVSENMRNQSNWKKATNLEEHTKLLTFLLQSRVGNTNEFIFLNALFWDADGVVCRGVENMAKDAYATWDIHSVYNASPSLRQYPPIFNMVKLGKYVESLSWDDIERGGMTLA